LREYNNNDCTHRVQFFKIRYYYTKISETLTTVYILVKLYMMITILYLSARNSSIEISVLLTLYYWIN